MRALKIAFHNPWPQRPGNRRFEGLRRAGAPLGVTFVDCADERDIEAARPDFVVCVTAAVPKIVDVPSYLFLHEPKSLILRERQHLPNALSYDGYLSVSDELAGFARDLCHGVGRSEEPGFFHATPPRAPHRAHWRGADRARDLRVAYCGTNRSRPMPRVFRDLDAAGILALRGPARDWAPLRLRGHEGAAPFDLFGPQRVYAAAGIGLALIDPRRQREDVVNDRIFEIAGAGAVAICPDVPWIRRWFADSVLYFDPDAAQPDIADAIIRYHAFCLAEPEAAEAMALRARAIVETHFVAERMVENLLAFHHRRQQERTARRAAMADAPHISVVVRCGGRAPALVRRAVDSIRRQSFGRFTVIFAKYRDIDLSEITADRTGAIADTVEFLIPAGGRARMLLEGVKRVQTEYFAVLDDDDFVLGDHFEEMFRAGRRVDERFDIAFSGVMEFDHPAVLDGAVVSRRNIARFGFSRTIDDVGDLLAVIHVAGFVARRDLLTPEMLAIPAMNTAEDSLLVGFLVRRTKPVFSFRPTAFYRRDGADASGWQTDPRRQDDELTLALRGSLAWAPQWLPAASMAVLARDARRIGQSLGRSALGEYADRLEPGEAGVPAPMGMQAPRGRAGLVCATAPTFLPVGAYRVTAVLEGQGGQPLAARGTLGGIEVLARTIGRVLARAPLQEAVEIDFDVTEEACASPIQLRVTAAEGGFTLVSLGLHRADAPPPASAPAVEAFLRALPDRPAAEPHGGTGAGRPCAVARGGPSAPAEGARVTALRRLRHVLAGALGRAGLRRRR